jgi:hypothetical protein
MDSVKPIRSIPAKIRRKQYCYNRNSLVIGLLAGGWGGGGGRLTSTTQTSANGKNEWSYTSAPPVYLHGVDKDSFIFFLAIILDAFLKNKRINGDPGTNRLSLYAFFV